MGKLVTNRVQGQYPDLDIEASLARLTEWLKRYRNTTYDFAEDSRRHRGLAARLRSIAAQLNDDEWLYLEEKFNETPPPTVGVDGCPIPYPFDNSARYKGLCARLTELAETADQMADGNPKPRAKPEQPMAADFFLHLWLAAGNERPSLYDSGPAVVALKAVFSNAGYELSLVRVRGILAAALEKFDPSYCLDYWQLDRFKVWRQ